MTVAANFPSIEPNNVNVSDVDTTQINISLSGRETRTQIARQYYVLQFSYENLTETQRKSILGHIGAARGSLLPFFVKLPTGLDDNSGGATGTLQVFAPGSLNDTSVSYTGPSSTTVFKQGDIIQFDNHSKIYTVTADSTTSSGGNGSVAFYPPLQVAVTTSETITYDNIQVLVRYTEDKSYEVRNDLYGSIKIEFKEIRE